MKQPKVWLIAASLFLAGTLLCMSLVQKDEPVGVDRLVSMQEISWSDYQEALDREKVSPVWDGNHHPPVSPAEETADYYRVTVQDEGYSDDLPIDAAIYFAMYKDGGLAEESCFTLMEMPQSPHYHNVITCAADGGEDVFLKLEISLVGSYDAAGRAVGSEEFNYCLTGFFDPETLEVNQLRVT